MRELNITFFFIAFDVPYYIPIYFWNEIAFFFYENDTILYWKLR